MFYWAADFARDPRFPGRGVSASPGRWLILPRQERLIETATPSTDLTAGWSAGSPTFGRRLIKLPEGRQGARTCWAARRSQLIPLKKRWSSSRDDAPSDPRRVSGLVSRSPLMRSPKDPESSGGGLRGQQQKQTSQGSKIKSMSETSHHSSIRKVTRQHCGSCLLLIDLIAEMDTSTSRKSNRC